MHFSRKVIIWLSAFLGTILVASLLLAASLNLVALPGKGEQVALGPSEESAGPRLTTTAKVVHPRQDARLTVTVRQLLTVEPLFEADLAGRGCRRRPPGSEKHRRPGLA